MAPDQAPRGSPAVACLAEERRREETQESRAISRSLVALVAQRRLALNAAVAHGLSSGRKDRTSRSSISSRTEILIEGERLAVRIESLRMDVCTSIWRGGS